MWYNLDCAVMAVALMSRLSQKAQLLDNPRHWNGFVVVCCFSRAQRLTRWSYHVREEPGEGSF